VSDGGNPRMGLILGLVSSACWLLVLAQTHFTEALVIPLTQFGLRVGRQPHGVTPTITREAREGRAARGAALLTACRRSTAANHERTSTSPRPSAHYTLPVQRHYTSSPARKATPRSIVSPWPRPNIRIVSLTAWGSARTAGSRSVSSRCGRRSFTDASTQMLIRASRGIRACRCCTARLMCHVRSSLRHDSTDARV